LAKKALGFLYLVIAMAAIGLTAAKIASFGWSMVAAAQPAPLLTNHYEISGHATAADAQGSSASSGHDDSR
jgi:hypothetical protein